MKVNPKKNSQSGLDKTVFWTVCSIVLLLVLILLVVNTCTDKREDGTDTFDTSSGTSDNAPDAPETNGGTDGDGTDTDNGFIFIPIEGENDIPALAVGEAELDASLLALTQDLGETQLDKYLFVCDSVIYGLETFEMLPKTDTDRVISGISSSFSLIGGADALVYLPQTDRILSVTDAVRELAPEYLLLSVGTDELLRKSSITDTDFYNAYRELVMSLREASPETTLVCMPILPGSDGDGINIYRAEKYNRYIHASAAEYGAYYIDIASAFANSSGYLRIDCDAGESKLNTTGLRRLTELIRTYDIPKPEESGTEAETE